MQLGILTFLRRSPKTFPSIAPQLAEPAKSLAASAGSETRSAATKPTADALPPMLPQAFRSERYGYTLTLPAGWRAIEPRPIAGSPPLDRFVDDSGMSLSIWNEPCPFRTLPAVPPKELVATLPLADGALVQFAAFAPSPKDGAQLLEGRWTARGRRWTVDAQAPSSAIQASVPDVLRQLVATLAVDG